VEYIGVVKGISVVLWNGEAGKVEWKDNYEFEKRA
jgi:hypothetical protein